MTEHELPEDFKLTKTSLEPGRFDWFKVWIIMIGVLAVWVAFCAGCATYSTVQPTWVPTIYVPVNGGCMFENSENPADTVMGGDLRMTGMYLTPIDEIAKTKSILNRCTRWGG